MAIYVVSQRLLFLLVLVASICLLSSPLVNGTDFEYCNKKANYPVKVTGIEIHPDPIERGETAQFKIFASSGNAISKGKLTIDVKYFFFHVHSETKDLCDAADCPISTGDFVIAHEQTLPSLTPPGSYTLTMKLNEEGGEELTCISFGFYIGFLSSEAAVADS